MEAWRDIEGFPGYRISTRSRVCNRHYHIMKPQLNRDGFRYVGLRRRGCQHNKTIGLLVARAFLERPEEYYSSLIYLDEVRSNDRLENLAWRPRGYAFRYQRQEVDRRPLLPYTVVNQDDNNEFRNSKIASRRYGILETEIVDSVFAGRPTLLGYTFCRK